MLEQPTSSKPQAKLELVVTNSEETRVDILWLINSLSSIIPITVA